MTRSRKLSITAVLSLTILAACGGGGGGAVIGDTASQFGQAFATAFRADDNAEPVEPSPITFLGSTGENVVDAPIDF
jgi:hypothetical protein